MKQIRKHVTYANVMSSIAVFLVLGGGAAYAAKKIGSNQIKGNSITTGKIKKNAVTASKIKKNSIVTAKIAGGAVTTGKVAANAITTDKIKNGAVTGDKVNLATLGTVPNSATTDVIRTSKGTIGGGQQVTAFEYSPFKLVLKCETYAGTQLRVHEYIESSAEGSIFTSWEDGSQELGPSTPETDREINSLSWGGGDAHFAYDSPSDVGVSASAPGGQGFTAFTGWGGSGESNTCWYWTTATIIG